MSTDRWIQEDVVNENPATAPDGPHPQGTGIRADGPTLSGMPDDAPPELWATLSGHEPEELREDVEGGAHRDV